MQYKWERDMPRARLSASEIPLFLSSPYSTQ